MPVIPLRAEPPATVGPTREWAKTYTLTIVGLLKIAEMVTSLMTFLCTICFGDGFIGGGWVNFATLSAFITVLFWFLYHVLNVIQDNIYNHYYEVISYAVTTLFLLIAAIIAAAGAGGSIVYGASAFFCFMSLFLWAADTLLQFVQLRSASFGLPPWSASPAAAAETASQPPAYTVEGGSTPLQGDWKQSAVQH